VSQQHDGIVRELHDEPTLRAVGSRSGSSTSVSRRGDLGPTELADRYDLNVADVYRALAYYHDHSEEMAAVESRRREAIETHREEAVTGPGDIDGSLDSGS